MSNKPYVIFIPGVKGSDLWEGENKRWFPKNIEDVNALNICNPMQSRSPLSIVNGFNVYKKKIYKGILKEFKNEEAEMFPYDWRLDIDLTADKLVSVISKLHNHHERIQLVAHSMGGLIAKLAILKLEDLGMSHMVYKLTTLGTPWHGAPDSYKALSFGEPGFFEDLSNFSEMFDDKKTRDLARQLPSVYQLLPSKHFFNNVQGKFLLTDEDQTNRVITYMDVQMMAQRFYDEMVKVHQIASNVWTDFMDPIQSKMLQPIPDHIQHDNLIGCQTPTLYELPIESPKERKPFKKDCRFDNGDGVVPVFSAIPTHKANLYYCSVQHVKMGSAKEVIQFIRWSLNGNVGDRPSKIDVAVNDDLFKQGVLAKIMCPVDSTILDDEHRYVAGVFDPNIEEISPHAAEGNVTYISIGEAKYVYFDESIKDDMILKINSYDNGLADISVKIYNSDSVQEEKFEPIPVSDEISATLRIPLSDRSQNTSLQVQNSTIKPKVKQRNKNETTNETEIDLPEIDIKILSNQDEKVKWRKVYSGSITLILALDQPENLASLFYTVDGGKPWRYSDPVNLDLESGSHTIEAFGKDIANRSLRTKKITINVDGQNPSTKLIVSLDPEGLDLSFKPLTNGARAESYYRIDHDGEFTKFEINEKVNLSPTKLRSDPNSYYEVEYYSINEFGKQSETHSLKLGLGNIPLLMWEEESPTTQPMMIWENIFKHEDLNVYDHEIVFVGKGIKASKIVTPNQDIPDNIRSVKFSSKHLEIDVRFLEKYSLYFYGAPTEVLEVGEEYGFSFELISERTHETITHTKPRAKLVAIRTNKIPDKHLELVEEATGLFRGKFIVDENFLKHRFKLVLMDLKNVKPPLREIPLIMKEEEE